MRHLNLIPFADSVSPAHVSPTATRQEIDIKAIAAKTGGRWPDLARELGLSPEDIDMVANEPLPENISTTEANRKRCEHMLSLWTQRSAAAGIKTPDELGK